MAQKCEAQIADFILNLHDTFTGDLATVKKSLGGFYSGCNVELDSKSRVIVDGRQVGTFTVSSKGKSAIAGKKAKAKSARKPKAPEAVTTPGEDTPAESQASGPGGSNESEKA